MFKKLVSLGVILGILFTYAVLPISADASQDLTFLSQLKTTGTGRPTQMCASDKYAFVVYNYNRVEVINIENPNSPTYLTSINSTDYVKDYGQSICSIALKDDYLLVAYKGNGNRNSTIDIYNVSQVNKDDVIRPVANLSSSSLLASNEILLEIDGDTGYVLVNNGLGKFDVSTATLQTAEATTQNNLEAAEPGTKVYATLVRVTTLCDDSTMLGSLKNYSYNNQAYGFKVLSNGAIHKSGNYLYYTVTSSYGIYLCMMEIAAEGCEMIGYYPLFDKAGTAFKNNPRCSGIWVNGTKVYVVPRAYGEDAGSILSENNNKVNGVYVLDMATAAANGTAETPIKLTFEKLDTMGGTFSTNSSITALTNNGDQLYVWGSGSLLRGIYMYDLTTQNLVRTKVFDATTVATLVNTGETHGDCQRSIVLNGDLMYSIDGESGFLVHRLPANEISAPVINNGTADLEVLENGNLKGKSTITNYSADAYKGLLVLAHYNTDGDTNTLIDLKIKPFEVPAGKKDYVVETEALSVNAGTSVKAMIWSDGLMPVHPATTIEPAQN